MHCTDEQAALRALPPATPPEALSPERIDLLLQHADECPACSAPLREIAARAILAQSPAVRPAAEREERMRARVLGRVASARPERKRAGVGQRRIGGWLAAASLALALLTHHGFHEPLRAGWLAAAGFAAVALGLGFYAHVQKERATALEERLHRGDRPGDRDGSAGGA